MSSPLSPDFHPSPDWLSTIRPRQAALADLASLAGWLQACAPLPDTVDRQRRALLEGMLVRPEAGPCVLVEQGKTPLGLLIVQLAPRLDLAGLGAFATEWWCLREKHESGAMLALCCDWLADWCRAHGIRHLLVAPGLAELAGGLRAGPLPSGLWHRDLAPAPKQLG